MTKKYGFLRFIAGFYKTIGIILAVVSVLSAVGILVSSILGGAALEGVLGPEFGLQGVSALGGVLGGILSAAVILIGGGLAAICQFAIGEAIMVFLAIEENTRATAGFLARKSV